jgi:hypothetical protein
MKDVFAIQDEISLAIVEKLKVQLLDEERAKIVKRYSDNPEAYNLYLKGLYFLNKWSEEGTRKGLEYIQKSIEVDPNFALAYLGIADLYTTIGLLSLSPPQEIFPKAKEMLRKSIIHFTKLTAYRPRLPSGMIGTGQKRKADLKKLWIIIRVLLVPMAGMPGI